MIYSMDSSHRLPLALDSRDSGAPDAFQARISAHLATFLRIYAHLYRICSPTLLCAPRHAFFRI